MVVTYNKRLPKLKPILEDSWKILAINDTERQKFTEKPLICYRRNKNLRDMIGQTRISRNKVVKGKKTSTGRCLPCRSRPDAKCCYHVISTNFFTNKTKEKKFEIRQKLGCKSQDAIYLAFCDKCNDKQYVGNVEQQKVHRQINKHRNDSKKEGTIAIDQHFCLPNHTFNDFRMIVIEEISNQNMTKDQIRRILLKREDFWITKLQTLEPHGFNGKLNCPQAQ